MSLGDRNLIARSKSLLIPFWTGNAGVGKRTGLWKWTPITSFHCVFCMETIQQTSVCARWVLTECFDTFTLTHFQLVEVLIDSSQGILTECFSHHNLKEQDHRIKIEKIIILKLSKPVSPPVISSQGTSYSRQLEFSSMTHFAARINSWSALHNPTRRDLFGSLSLRVNRPLSCGQHFTVWCTEIGVDHSYSVWTDPYLTFVVFQTEFDKTRWSSSWNSAATRPSYQLYQHI